jgi:hypothetical protein
MQSPGSEPLRKRQVQRFIRVTHCLSAYVLRIAIVIKVLRDKPRLTSEDASTSDTGVWTLYLRMVGLNHDMFNSPATVPAAILES